GHFGRKEKNGWRSQGRNGTENINHHGGYHGGGSRIRTNTFQCGKGEGLYENNVSDNETGKKEDKEVPKQFEAEDFVKCIYMHIYTHTHAHTSPPPFSPEYPLNPKSRSPRISRMMVIKKGSAKELQISVFPVVGSLHSQSVKDGTGTSVYKGLVPKPVTPPAKWKSQAKKNKLGNPFSHESAYGIGNFSPFKSTAKAFTVSQNSVKECNWSNSSSPIDRVGQPRLTKLTRMRTDRKNEFLKALKQDRVEEEHEDENRAGQEK
ncbi:GPBP1 protein, partial [Phaetusa simplex]|nr:GPBP1 protein [Phaetusa simplex]